MVVRILHNACQTSREGAAPFLSQQVGDRAGEFAIQPFYTMGKGVHATRCRERWWPAVDEFRIVENGARQDTRVAPGSLVSCLSKAIDRRHLRTRKGRWDRNNWHIDCKGERFTQTNRRATSQGHNTIRVGFASDGHAFLNEGGWHVLRNIAIDP